MVISDKFKEKDFEIESINFYDEFNGSASGGTIETISNSLNMKSIDKYQAKVKFDPLLMNENGQKSEFGTTDASCKTIYYSRDMKSWCGFWLMVPVMITCVKRSNALLGYSKNLRYSEAQVFRHGFMFGFQQIVMIFVFLTCMLNAPLRWLMRKFVLPKPGEGPSENSLKKGYLKITAIGTSQGKTQKAVLYFPKDPGYIETARMLVESGLTLALNSEKIKVKGGIHTPASCLGYTVLDRLIVGGTTIDVAK